MSKRTSLILGAALFFGIFFLRYLSIDPSFYQFRDDGLITLSHVKNWIDFGFIGINPSGGIVEGYSTPLQFIIFSVIYFFTHAHYVFFIPMMTSLCTLGIAVISMQFFLEKKYYAVLIVGLFALFLAFQSSFIEWHGSGMENPLTHFFFIFAVWVFCEILEKGKINFYWCIIPFLALLARIDSIVHIFPAMMIFGLLWYRKEKNISGFKFVAAVLALWVGFHFLRYLYFGNLMPNTAAAQDISLGQRLYKLISFDASIWSQGFELFKNIFKSHAGYFFVSIFFIPFINFKEKYWPMVLMSISLVLSGFIYPFIFGPSRLDFSRTNSHIPIFIFLMVIGIFLALKKPMMKKVMGITVLLGAGLIYTTAYVPPYYLCCDTAAFKKTHTQFNAILMEQDVHRPTIANPDLGIMSWYKDMNILDLGMIGTPLMAKTKNPRVISDFIFDYVAPDIIQSHEIWSCLHYNTIFMDPRFKTKYLVVIEEFEQFGSHCDAKPLPKGIWIRKDILRESKSNERIFLNELQKGISVEVVQKELEFCQAGQDCAYVSRTVYRFIPEFKRVGLFDNLIDTFSKMPTTNDMDWYMLLASRDTSMDAKAINFLNDRIQSRFSKK